MTNEQYDAMLKEITAIGQAVQELAKSLEKLSQDNLATGLAVVSTIKGTVPQTEASKFLSDRTSGSDCLAALSHRHR